MKCSICDKNMKSDIKENRYKCTNKNCDCVIEWSTEKRYKGVKK